MQPNILSAIYSNHVQAITLKLLTTHSNQINMSEESIKMEGKGDSTLSIENLSDIGKAFLEIINKQNFSEIGKAFLQITKLKEQNSDNLKWYVSLIHDKIMKTYPQRTIQHLTHFVFINLFY